MIPFTPHFLKWINPGKCYDNEINIENLIKKFECMMIEYIQKKKKVFYFKIPKEYNCVRKQFLENIVSNLEKEGFTHNESIDTKTVIARTYSFYTSYLKYTKLVKVNPKLVKEYNYESPLYIEYGSLEDAIGIKVCI